MRKHKVLVMCVSFLIIGLFFGKARAGDRLNYPVYLLKQAPVMDGRIEGDIAWNEIPSRTNFFVLGGGHTLAKQTTFKACYDESNLYIAVKCDEPDIKLIKAVCGDNDPAMWKEDGIEIFVFPQDSDSYFQCIVNTAGARINYLTNINDGFHEDIPLREWKAAIYKGEDFYSIEVAIPFKTIGKKPKDKEEWKGNICRNITVFESGGDRSTSWAPMKKGFHEHENFGRLIFIIKER